MNKRNCTQNIESICFVRHPFDFCLMRKRVSECTEIPFKRVAKHLCSDFSLSVHNPLSTRRGQSMLNIVSISFAPSCSNPVNSRKRSKQLSMASLHPHFPISLQQRILYLPRCRLLRRFHNRNTVSIITATIITFYLFSLGRTFSHLGTLKKNTFTRQPETDKKSQK